MSARGSALERLHEACAHTLPDGEACIVLDYGDLRAIRARLEELERAQRPPQFDNAKLRDQFNALPEPLRGWVHWLDTNADPSGNIREAVCQRENAKALALRVEHLEFVAHTVAAAMRQRATWGEQARDSDLIEWANTLEGQ